MYRAFFALPDTITAPDGRPVNAIHGYLDMTATLIRNREPGDVVHCFDHDWRPAARVALYEGYKADRPPEPNELTAQFAMLREVLDALGMAQAEAPGWEAEDAIGSLCARADSRDRLEIVTGDRDLTQLVRDPRVRLLYTRRGVSQLDVLDEAGVESKYGVPAARYADFATLRGDPSDGLPGVKGVGEKTARLLMTDYASLEELLEDLRRPVRRSAALRRSPALRARLAEAADYLEAMKQVVPIRTDVEVVLRRPARDGGQLDRVAEVLGLTGPLGRLRSALSD
jgi:5'-3' exonuclease